MLCHSCWISFWHWKSTRQKCGSETWSKEASSVRDLWVTSSASEDKAMGRQANTTCWNVNSQTPCCLLLFAKCDWGPLLTCVIGKISYCKKVFNHYAQFSCQFMAKLDSSWCLCFFARQRISVQTVSSSCPSHWSHSLSPSLISDSGGIFLNQSASSSNRALQQVGFLKGAVKK